MAVTALPPEPSGTPGVSPPGLPNPFVRLLLNLYDLERDADPSYSLEKWGQKLQCSRPYLSQVLSGQRGVGASLIRAVCREYPQHHSEIARALAKLA